MQKVIQRRIGYSLILFLLEIVACGVLFFTMDSDYLSAYIKEIFLGTLLVIIFLNLMLLLYNLIKISNSKLKTDFSSLDVFGNDIQKAYDFGKLGLLIVDDNNNIVWTNTYFNAIQTKLIDHNLFDWQPTLKNLLDTKIDEMKIEINNKNYLVKLLPQAKMYIFKDVTTNEDLLRYSIDHAPAVGIIAIDNYQELANILDDVTINDALASMQKVIIEYAKKFNLLLKKYRNDSYLFICTRKDYLNLINDKLSLLQAVRSVTNESDNEFTLSIGMASGTDNYSRLFEMASTSLDVSLSRGGNQAVVFTYGENLRFIGGQTESKEKKNSVQSRVMSNSLTALIAESNDIYIMGHNIADLDAIGACLGVYCLASATTKKIKIVYDEFALESKTKKAFKQLFSKEQINELTISPNKAVDTINSKSLLIIVDVHNPQNTISPSLVKKAERIAVIDHHRRGEKYVEKTEFNYIDPSASSASEMVVEMIKYSSKNIQVPEPFATFMLAGIILDTNYYRKNISAKTYDASYVLKNFGADNVVANSFLKEEYEEYALKNKIMSNSFTPYYGVIIARADQKDIVEQAMLARVATETLEISGINACFVVGRVSDKDVGISSRSDGSISCQILCEKLGGGGSFTAAAAKFHNKTVEEVVQEVKNVLDNYLEDARNKKVGE